MAADKAKAGVAEIETVLTLETGEAVEKAGAFVAGVAAATHIG